MRTLATLASTLLCPALIITVGYIALCAVRPFRRCGPCAGTGHIRTRYLGRIKPCHRCKDQSGLRLRYGWRLANRVRRLVRDAQ